MNLNYADKKRENLSRETIENKVEYKRAFFFVSLEYSRFKSAVTVLLTAMSRLQLELILLLEKDAK